MAIRPVPPVQPTGLASVNSDLGAMLGELNWVKVRFCTGRFVACAE